MSEKFPDTPDNLEEVDATPPRSVINPHLPLDGDPEEYDPEPVQEQLMFSSESNEPREEPNDLSGIDKEFEDEFDQQHDG